MVSDLPKKPDEDAGGTGCAGLAALRRCGALPMATAGSVSWLEAWQLISCFCTIQCSTTRKMFHLFHLFHLFHSQIVHLLHWQQRPKSNAFFESVAVFKVSPVLVVDRRSSAKQSSNGFSNVPKSSGKFWLERLLRFFLDFMMNLPRRCLGASFLVNSLTHDDFIPRGQGDLAIWEGNLGSIVWIFGHGIMYFAACFMSSTVIMYFWIFLSVFPSYLVVCLGWILSAQGLSILAPGGRAVELGKLRVPCPEKKTTQQIGIQKFIQLFIPNFCSQVWSLQAVRAFREDILYATMLPNCKKIKKCPHWIFHPEISEVVGCAHRPSGTNLGCGSSKHRSSHSCDLMQEGCQKSPKLILIHTLFGGMWWCV